MAHADTIIEVQKEAIARLRAELEQARRERDEARALVVANSREYGEIYAELESRIAEVERERDAMRAELDGYKRAWSEAATEACELAKERDAAIARAEAAEARAERAERACVDIFNAFATSRSIDQAISVRNAWTLGREIVVRELDAKYGSGS